MYIKSSRKQVVVCLPTAEADYALLSACRSEVQGTLQIRSEQNTEMNNTTQHHADNTATIAWAEKAIKMRKVKLINN